MSDITESKSITIDKLNRALSECQYEDAAVLATVVRDLCMAEAFESVKGPVANWMAAQTNAMVAGQDAMALLKEKMESEFSTP